MSSTNTGSGVAQPRSRFTFKFKFKKFNLNCSDDPPHWHAVPVIRRRFKLPTPFNSLGPEFPHSGCGLLRMALVHSVPPNTLTICSLPQIRQKIPDCYYHPQNDLQIAQSNRHYIQPQAHHHIYSSPSLFKCSKCRPFPVPQLPGTS